MDPYNNQEIIADMSGKNIIINQFHLRIIYSFIAIIIIHARFQIFKALSMRLRQKSRETILILEGVMVLYQLVLDFDHANITYRHRHHPARLH